MSAFVIPTDIADAALLLLGARTLSQLSITTSAGWSSSTDIGAALSLMAYDKVRQAELRRHLWRFSARRAQLRPITSTTKLLTFGTYNAGSTYAAGDVIADSSGNPWISLQGSNTGNTPSAYGGGFWTEFCGPQTADAFSTTVSYNVADIVLSTNYYISLVNGNKNHTPPSAGNWLVLTTQPTAATVFVDTPVPLYQNAPATARSVYYTPTRYLRLMPQDPKAPGIVNQKLGSGQQWSDLDQEGPYLLSTAATLLLRYAANVELVSHFDPLYCEGVAARLARDLSPRIDPLRFDLAMKVYDGAIREARVVDALESGATDREDDALPPLAPSSAQREQGGAG